VFDEVTRREGGHRAARKSAYVLGSTAFQVAFIIAVILVGDRIKARVAEEIVAEVKFVRPAAPPPPPPPPPPPAPKPSAPRPKTEPAKPRPPEAMLQPKEVAPEMKPPDPNAPPEPEVASSDQGTTGGVVGGVVGGVPQQTGQGIEDAPAYATAGFRKPEQAQRNCVQESVRIPADLKGFISGPITVKFAVGRDGAVSLFQVMGQVPDQRIASAIWQAIQSCQFTPGADAQGRPTRIWVILPLRFTSG